MLLALESLVIISLLELLLWSPLIWKSRKIAAPALAVLLAVGSLVLVGVNPAAWTALIAIISLYRCVNLARIAAGRVQADHLFHVSRQTSLWLIGCQALLAASAGLSRHYSIGTAAWWMIAACAMLASAVVILGSAYRHLRTTKAPKLTRQLSTAELPALTVAIPARNETTDLEECLKSLLTSSYPKLEILVLDDCSQNKRTSEIIRGFAHAGVEFIAGTEPPKSWLAKNYAYDKLTEAANGEILLFCGVDTQFEPDSLVALVSIMIQKQKNMISILPRNILPQSWDLRSWLTQPNRYAWELALPRRLMRRPPVLSTCWLITRQALEAAGGFQAVRRKGVPESYMARAVAADSDGYSFIQSNERLGISSRKAPDEQRATAIRTRYLQMHRKPEMTALIGLAELGVLVMPPVLAVIALVGDEPWIAGLAGLSFLMNCLVYSRLVNLTYRRFVIKGVWLLPLATLYDVWLLNYSMWRYEFSEVLWKGRNVCIPVMRVVPKLPDA